MLWYKLHDSTLPGSPTRTGLLDLFTLFSDTFHFLNLWPFFFVCALSYFAFIQSVCIGMCWHAHLEFFQTFKIENILEVRGSEIRIHDYNMWSDCEKLEFWKVSCTKVLVNFFERSVKSTKRFSNSKLFQENLSCSNCFQQM